jgi:membrane peptidoglycan carboxypeptidase
MTTLVGGLANRPATPLGYATDLSDRLSQRRLEDSSVVLARAIGVPSDLVTFLLAIEDKRFGAHPGVDWVAIFRAGLRDAVAGGWVEGASTLTQQVVRLRLTRVDRQTRTLRTKAREALVALHEERRRSKPEILSEYLERSYWGRNFFGWSAAAIGYFGVDPKLLSRGQSFFLAERLACPNAAYPHRIVRLLGRRPIAARMTQRDLAEICSAYEQHFQCGGQLWLHLAKFPKR